MGEQDTGELKLRVNAFMNTGYENLVTYIDRVNSPTAFVSIESDMRHQVYAISLKSQVFILVLICQITGFEIDAHRFRNVIHQVLSVRL